MPSNLSESACATVLGKPSSKYPFLQSCDLILSFTIAIIISSETRPPASMTFFAFRPIGVPATTVARNISPVDI